MKRKDSRFDRLCIESVFEVGVDDEDFIDEELNEFDIEDEEEIGGEF